jgi:hypothetical protein
MTTVEMVNYEIGFELPFAYFLANDLNDFDDYMDWLTDVGDPELRVTQSSWHITGTRYGVYKGDLDKFFKEWYDMPADYGENPDEQAILIFTLSYTLRYEKGEEKH